MIWPPPDRPLEGERVRLEPLEGISRKHTLMPITGVRDSAYFSIVDDEWPSVRQNLETRLAGVREVESA